uniref:GDSL esterase/lipase n=1 Tax=Ananas comosus var. bracteatus TaxID=296719 RepID=A0A6V7QGK0_ANACO|nr:unnamed protein product [Ananas comosus var. bracteatus]
MQKLINEGAGTLVVPGILPTGCIPIVLSQAHNAPKEEFDPKTGCLIKPNDFSSYHNNLLHQAVQQLQSKYPQAKLIYAEYFEAVVDFILDPIGHGFTNGHGALQVCCGGGGPYNYNSSAGCGSPGSTVGDPATYANWDGIHLTEAAFQQVANGWLHGPYASPPIVS